MQKYTYIMIIMCVMYASSTCGMHALKQFFSRAAQRQQSSSKKSRASLKKSNVIEGASFIIIHEYDGCCKYDGKEKMVMHRRAECCGHDDDVQRYLEDKDRRVVTFHDVHGAICHIRFETSSKMSRDDSARDALTKLDPLFMQSR